MKPFKIIILIFAINFLSVPAFSQIPDNPIKELSEKLLQNEMLSYRFFRNFVFIKTNTFKKKTMADMDKGIALFDNNLSYIVLHLPEHHKIQQDFLKLQNFWNIYRLNITNFEKDNYQSLIVKTKKLHKFIHQLNSDILDKHPGYSTNKKPIELAKLAIENSKKTDAIAIVYVLQKGLNFPDAINYFDVDMISYKKNLKKIGKFKALNPKAKSLIDDLKAILESIKILLQKENFNPKMMYAYSNTFGKKNFKLFNYLIQTINQ